MYLFLLKKALPFTLTFIFGAALSGLLGLFGSSEKKGEYVFGTRTYEYGSRCRMRRHHLVAESKPLAILYKPDARVPGNFSEHEDSARVEVTFGSDGQVQKVRPVGRSFALYKVNNLLPVWNAVEKAAQGIRFTPETVNGIPVTVEREVDIRFLAE
ncbi:MAG TPA: hypothetical protein VF591_12130 [Pyrinomonadaceae bacterium]|jgi:hypothetical protein